MPSLSQYHKRYPASVWKNLGEYELIFGPGIGKDKVRNPYEFGVKVSVSSGGQALQASPQNSLKRIIHDRLIGTRCSCGADKEFQLKNQTPKL